MSEHKFAVGQTVRFLPGRYQGGTAPGSFKIVRLMPESASVFLSPPTKREGHHIRTHQANASGVWRIKLSAYGGSNGPKVCRG